jgi:uncharacterized phage protein (TIGR01671 family)
VGKYMDDRGVSSVRIMQCTGLTDMNGEFIYEGDILESQELVIVPDIKVYGELCEVTWDGDRYFLRAIKGGWGKLSENLSNNYFKIIGNIYENPELLIKNNESKGEQNEIE